MFSNTLYKILNVCQYCFTEIRTSTFMRKLYDKSFSKSSVSQKTKSSV